MDCDEVTSAAVWIEAVGEAAGPDATHGENLLDHQVPLAEIAAAGEPVDNLAEAARQVDEVADRARRIAPEHHRRAGPEPPDGAASIRRRASRRRQKGVPARRPRRRLGSASKTCGLAGDLQRQPDIVGIERRDERCR